jgi:hypothetical protein
MSVLCTCSSLPLLRSCQMTTTSSSSHRAHRSFAQQNLVVIYLSLAGNPRLPGCSWAELIIETHSYSLQRNSGKNVPKETLFEHRSTWTYACMIWVGCIRGENKEMTLKTESSLLRTSHSELELNHVSATTTIAIRKQNEYHNWHNGENWRKKEVVGRITDVNFSLT